MSFFFGKMINFGLYADLNRIRLGCKMGFSERSMCIKLTHYIDLQCGRWTFQINYISIGKKNLKNLIF